MHGRLGRGLTQQGFMILAVCLASMACSGGLEQGAPGRAWCRALQLLQPALGGWKLMHTGRQ